MTTRASVEDIALLYERMDALHRRVTKLESPAAPQADSTAPAAPNSALAGQGGESPAPTNETQYTINSWATSMFGVVHSDWRCAARLLEEVAELMVELSPDDSQSNKICEECADCWIVMCRLATRAKIDVLDAERTLPKPVFLPGCAVGDYGAVIVKMMWQMLVCVHTGAPGLAPLIGRLSAALRNLCLIFGSMLAYEVDRKMAINRRREWKLTGDGHAYHVKHATGDDPGDQVRYVSGLQGLQPPAGPYLQPPDNPSSEHISHEYMER
jgi:hypothetical protein